MKILFVCSMNKYRSKTAEAIFKEDGLLDVKSAGTSELSSNPISKELLEWANIIFVMEKRHMDIIHKKFPDVYKKKKIVCLYIEDIYDYMQLELVYMLRIKLRDYGI